MKSFLFGLFGLFVALGMTLMVNCSPAAAPSSESVRAVARGTVLVAEDAWVSAAKVCMTVAETQNDDTVRQKCSAVLVPAHDVILAAANSVDAWQAADQANFGCLARDMVGVLAQMSALMTDVGQTTPAVLTDALALANQFAPQCTAASAPDAGSGG